MYEQAEEKTAEPGKSSQLRGRVARLNDLCDELNGVRNEIDL